jgi:transglutaminase-like putative cysteine protease
MQWLKDLWNRIVSSNDEPYLKRIQELEDENIAYKLYKARLENELSELDTKLEIETDNYLFMKEQFESVQKLKNELLEELDSLKHVVPDYEIPHEIIDVNNFAYLPSTLIYYYDTRTKGIATKSVPVTISKYYRMWDDNMYQFFRNAVKNCKTMDEKFIKLRDVIKAKVTYQHDVTARGITGENWRFPLETFYGEVGDCEDTTVLWVTACHICGLPADRFFNATGDYKGAGGTFGHSWGIAKFNDGSWRVIETTSTRAPLVFKDNKEYFCKGFLNGLSNAKMAGKAKKETF